MGRGDVAHVERRILPHQHHVDILAQIDPLGFAFLEMIAFDPLQRDRIGFGKQSVVSIERQAFNMILEHLMATLLRCQHQRERGIPGDVDILDRVHLDGDT